MTSMPMCVNVLLSRFLRCPSLGGFSLYMAVFRPFAAEVIAATVLAFGPDSPTFSPAALQCTPCALIRLPNAGSPGHWCDRPQPAAIVRLCLCALATRPGSIVYGRSPAAVRQALVWSRTAFATES